MFLLITYLVSLTVSTYTMDGTTLKIADETSITSAAVGSYTTATAIEITSSGAVSIENQALRSFASLKTISINAGTVTLNTQCFQQTNFPDGIKVVAATSITVGQDAFIDAQVGTIDFTSNGDIIISQQGFETLTKTANVSLVAQGKVTIGLDAFIQSPIKSVHIEANGDIECAQQSFQQVSGMDTLEIVSKEGKITFGITAFIAASINEVILRSYLGVDIQQQAMQQVKNFNYLYVETYGNFTAGLDTFISSSIREFYIRCNGSAVFAQQSFQETPNLINFTVEANQSIQFDIASFISSNVNSITLYTNGPVYFGQKSFQECKNLSSLVIHSPANITFGPSAFIDSQIQALNITYVTNSSSAMLLAQTATTVTFEKQSFQGCKQLTSVDVNTHSNVDVQASSFTDSTALKKVNIKSDGKATVGENAFQGCSALDGGANIEADEKDVSPNAYGDGGDDGGKKKKSGSSSHKDNDDDSEASAKTLGNIDIETVYLGTSPNIVIDLNIMATLMRKVRLALGRVAPSPDFIHTGIWVGPKDATDSTRGAIFVYGKYWNKKNLPSYLEENGAKAYVMTLKEFKERYPSIEVMKLNANRKMKLFNFIDEVKESGNWKATDYNWPTNNCQHFTAKLINILQATRDVPNNNDWVDIPKNVLNSLEENEKKN
ncbi:hypothetical protein M9Y10_020738 [Tritrichomonas musculus]|uniref:Uncharacterized protein n=1 Tax=Tritrichomonas musculus TaxID=1915356 RepID=A0ABR2HEH6_9EUKA